MLDFCIKRRIPKRFRDTKLMTEVCSFYSAACSLQPNCALVKYRAKKTLKAAIKISHLNKHTPTHTFIGHPMLLVCTIVCSMCMWAEIQDSNPPLLNLHPLRNLCFSFYCPSVIHSYSANYCKSITPPPPVSCISSQHSSVALVTASHAADFQ